MSRVAVIGGGAAGMFAAIAAAGNGHRVDLYEKNEKLGKKIYITGKGRCNLTNACDMEELFESVCTNRKFLFSAFYGFTNQDTIRFFEESGMPVKIERGNRVFPVSDHSSDVINALIRQLKKHQVSIHLLTEVQTVLTKNGQVQGIRLSDQTTVEADAVIVATGGLSYRTTGSTGDGYRMAGEQGHTVTELSPVQTVLTKNGQVQGIRLSDQTTVEADAVIVATGGLSYRTTGSTGDGYRMAGEQGHTVTELSPSLVPLMAAEEDVKLMQGLSLRNVQVTVRDGKKVLFDEFGEMMFTHFGVTGPLILSASSRIQKELKKHPLEMHIDLKPALSAQQLDARILREFEQAKNKQFKNVLGSLYPAKMIPVIMERSGIEPEKPVHDISREERQRLLQATKAFSVTITGLGSFKEAVITRGGISVKEIDPATMESKLVKGLYFAGEVLDLDAVTGGFNLQIAWSTGYAAGNAAGS